MSCEVDHSTFFALSQSTPLVHLSLVLCLVPGGWTSQGKSWTRASCFQLLIFVLLFISLYLTHKYISQCAYSESLLACRIRNLHPYLLTLGKWPCFPLSRGNWYGHLNPLASFHLNLLCVLTLVLLSMHLRDRTVPHLRGNISIWSTLLP